MTSSGGSYSVPKPTRSVKHVDGEANHIHPILHSLDLEDNFPVQSVASISVIRLSKSMEMCMLSLNNQTYCEPFVDGRGSGNACTKLNFCCRTCPLKKKCPNVAFLTKNHPQQKWKSCKYVEDRSCPYEMTFAEMAMEILKRRIFSDA